jgi:steroid 5-alpha reductase family enzyme
MHIIYGVRLCLFLSYRELKIPRFREMREKIEEQAPRGGRLARAPFILQCGLLYLWMSCPLFVLATLPAEKFLSPLASVTAAATSASLQGFCSAIVPLLLSVAGLGLALQIVGDTHKLLAKRADPDRLVTSGLFRFLRHPNYTGEHVLWGASSLAGISAVFGAPDATAVMSTSVRWALLAGCLLGYVGIGFVLTMAATGLEKRQAMKYSRDPSYAAWQTNSWAGPTFTRAQKNYEI